MRRLLQVEQICGLEHAGSLGESGPGTKPDFSRAAPGNGARPGRRADGVNDPVKKPGMEYG